MSVLMNLDEADFVYLKKKTESTAGKPKLCGSTELSSADIFATEKVLPGKKTRTVCRVTSLSREAFENIRNSEKVSESVVGLLTRISTESSPANVCMIKKRGEALRQQLLPLLQNQRQNYCYIAP